MLSDQYPDGTLPTWEDISAEDRVSLRTSYPQILNDIGIRLLGDDQVRDVVIALLISEILDIESDLKTIYQAFKPATKE